MTTNNNTPAPTTKRTMPIDLNISPEGINQIKQREGLLLHAYDDIGGTRTIGYGHAHGVHAGEFITEQQALDLLHSDVDHVANIIRRSVNVPLTQHNFDALVSFIFNIGEEGWLRSQVLKHLNAGEYHAAAIHMTSWHKVHGAVSKGLWNRRKDEVRQFLDNPDAI